MRSHIFSESAAGQSLRQAILSFSFFFGWNWGDNKASEALGDSASGQGLIENVHEHCRTVLKGVAEADCVQDGGFSFSVSLAWKPNVS